MVTLIAHYDGKVIVPDEPVALTPNQKLRVTVETLPDGPAFTPYTDLTAALMNGDTWDEKDALHVDPVTQTPDDFVRRPGSAAGEIEMTDDFDDTPPEFKAYL